MATRKRSMNNDDGDAARGFAVLVEEMRAHFKVFGERLEGLDQRVTQGFAQVDARFAQVDARFVQVDARFAQIDARFSTIDARFSTIDDQLTDVRYELGQVKSAVLENTRMLKQKVDRSEVEGMVQAALARKGR